MLWRIARGRIASSWRLLLVVLLVATLSATTVASLGLLVVATEQAGLRTALAALPPSQSGAEVDLQQVTGSIANTTTVTTKAVQRVLGPGIAVTSSNMSFTMLNASTLGGADPDVSYFGELDGVRSHATLLSGAWPRRTAESATAVIPVVVPAAGAGAVHLRIGDTFSLYLDFKGNTRTAQVVGTYAAKDPKGDYWGQDPLHGAGVNYGYPSFYGSSDKTIAFGPLLVAPGQLDASAAPIDAMHLTFTPKFDQMTIDQLAPVISRLDTAQNDLPVHMGYAAQQITFSSALGPPLGHIASNLIVTRSTVVIVTLMLLVLAIAALSQTARLFTDSQAGERQLMLARGASRSQIFGLSAIEAATVGLVTAALSPVLARLAYQLLALLPAMTAAHMPKDVGLPALAWELGLGVALVFVIVLVAPLFRRPTTFVEGQQKRFRQRRGSGLLRSGLDLALVVIAGVLYWQLMSYRSPVGGGVSLSIDPVLAAAPVVVLLATTLVSVRLIPTVARIADRRATRSRGSVFPLAAWEVGRRSRQATAAVLLLTLALAVGTFGQSFLATWQQSQVDQANLAVGPPMRVPANGASVGSQGAALATGAIGKPQPVIHRIAAVVDGSGEDTDNLGTVLGLSEGARELLATGRDGEIGGAQVAKLPTYDAGAGAAIALPGDVRGLQAVVRIGTAGSALPGVSVNLAAVIQNGNGLLTTVQLGSVPVNGEPQVVRGLLPVKARGPAPLKFVGFESFATVSDRAAYGDGNSQASEDILLGQLAVLRPSTDAGEYATAPVTVDRHLPWVAEEIFGGTERPTSGNAPSGWQLRLSVVIPPEVDQQGAGYLLEGWTPIASVPAVVTSALAKAVNVKVGDNLALDVSGAQVDVKIVKIVQLIPGAADFTALSAATASGGATAAIGSVAVDQAQLERALVQGGQSGPMVDEWWVDVPAGHGAAYLASHPTAGNGGVSREVLALQMQQDPLRVATQAALWLSIVAAALLAAIGFAVHTAASMRSRRLEFAQLRAIGLSRRSLAGVVGAESLLLCAIGTVFGVAIGVLLSWLVGPLVAVSPDGSPAVPAVAIVVPMGAVALLILEVVAVLALVVLAVAVAQRSISPAQILRGADE